MRAGEIVHRVPRLTRDAQRDFVVCLFVFHD